MGRNHRRALARCVVATAIVGASAAIVTPKAHGAWNALNGEIAFVTNGRIAVRNADGSNRQFLTTPPEGNRDEGVAWSPGGTKIAFLRSTNGKGEIWTANADGSSPTKVTSTNNAVVGRPTWSPEGTRIAYSVGATTPPSIRIVNSDGTGDTELTRFGGVDATWSPAGHLIAFSTPDAITAVGPEPGSGHSLGLEKGTLLDWTPDATRLGFVGTDKKLHIAEYEDPTNQRVLNIEPTSGFAFSPDGTRIAFGCLGNKAGGGTETHICTATAEGTNIVDITAAGSPAAETQPAWRPRQGSARFGVSPREPRPGDTVTISSITPCPSDATEVALLIQDADGAVRGESLGIGGNGAWTTSFRVRSFETPGYNFLYAQCRKAGTAELLPRYNPQYVRVSGAANPAALITVGQGEGGSGRFATVSADPSNTFVPAGVPTFGPGYAGPISVARGNVDADSPGDEIIVGSGVTWYPTQVAVYSQRGQLLRSAKPFGETFAGGLSVAVGDIAGDDLAEIIVGAGPGGGPHVRSYDGKLNAIGPGFFAFGESFLGGINVAAGQLVAAAKQSIIVGAGPGGGPHVRVFSSNGNPTLGDGFFAYGSSFRGGVHVAAGDLRSGGVDEIITGAGSGGAPHVRVFSAAGEVVDNGFYAYGPNFTGGVRVAAGDLDGVPGDELVTGAGPGGAPHVRTFFADFSPLGGFYAFEQSFTGGVSVTTGYTVAIVLPRQDGRGL